MTVQFIKALYGIPSVNRSISNFKILDMVRNILFAAALLLSATAQAQNFAVQGTVTGSDDGQPMTGVNVVVKGGTAGASTDIDGHYSLNVSAGTDTLIFSYLGYITQHIGINNRNVVDVVLPLDVAILDDIVVVGYGTQKKSDLTGAVSSVRGSDLTKIPAASPVQALQGKVAGVQVTSTSGAPGAGAVVRVRGVVTFHQDLVPPADACIRCRGRAPDAARTHPDREGLGVEPGVEQFRGRCRDRASHHDRGGGFGLEDGVHRRLLLFFLART